MRVDDIGKTGPFARLDWIVPMALQGLTALMFLIAWLKVPTDSAVHLGKLMELEFLAIHAGAFHGVLDFWLPAKPSSCLLRVIGFIVFVEVYLAAGYRALRWTGIFEIGAKILTFCSGLLWGVGANRNSRIKETGTRWLFCFVVFLILANWLRLPEDVGSRHKGTDVLLLARSTSPFSDCWS